MDDGPYMTKYVDTYSIQSILSVTFIARGILLLVELSVTFGVHKNDVNNFTIKE